METRNVNAATDGPEAAPAGSRPFGLYAIITLILVNAVLIALDVSRSYVSLGLEFGLARPTLPGLDDVEVDRLLRLLIAGAWFIVAIGLWARRRWAWTAMMIMVGVALGEGLLLYMRGEPRYIIMLFNVMTVFYINQRSVQLLFLDERASAQT
ncbi:MAG: hypothetical protein KFH98_15610 [Gemmatimonadetes bacterium]|nr:hypothetical protein [Gemmatimonadota bacterium]